MSVGQGSISVNQKKDPGGSGPPGPPFAINSADNGVSIDPVSGRIVLGQSLGAVGDPARLLDAREVPLNLFSLAIGKLDTIFFIDELNQVAALGDWNGLGSQSTIQLNTNAGFPRFQYYSFNGTYLDANPAANRFRFGDMDDGFNGTYLNIDDQNALAQLGDSDDNLNGFKVEIKNFPSPWAILGDANGAVSGSAIYIDDQPLFQYFDNNGTWIEADPAADRYRFGDVDNSNNGIKLDINDSISHALLGDTANTGNGTRIEIDDPTQRIRGRAPVVFAEMLDLDFVNRLYRIGEFDNGSDFDFSMDAANQLAKILLGSRFLEISVPGQRYQFGDLDGAINNSRLDINGAPGSAVGALVVGGNPMVEAFEVSRIVDLGDVGHLGGGTVLRINDGGQEIEARFALAQKGFVLDMLNSIYYLGSPGSAQPVIVVDNNVNRVYTTDFAQLIGTNGTNFTNNAAGNVGTLNNSPLAGNPTKWIPINDNGTIRNIPAW